MKITREHVDKALNEIERRISIDLESIVTGEEWEVKHMVLDKIDGMNSTFMMISDNWPEVSAWIEKGIEERGLV